VISKKKGKKVGRTRGTEKAASWVKRLKKAGGALESDSQPIRWILEENKKRGGGKRVPSGSRSDVNGYKRRVGQPSSPRTYAHFLIRKRVRKIRTKESCHRERGDTGILGLLGHVEPAYTPVGKGRGRSGGSWHCERDCLTVHGGGARRRGESIRSADTHYIGGKHKDAQRKRHERCGFGSGGQFCGVGREKASGRAGTQSDQYA